MQWAALLHGLHTNTRAQRDQQPALGVLQVTGGPEMPVFPPIDFSEPWDSAQHSSTHLSALLTLASDPGSESLFHVMKVCLEFIIMHYLQGELSLETRRRIRSHAWPSEADLEPPD